MVENNLRLQDCNRFVGRSTKELLARARELPNPFLDALPRKDISPLQTLGVSEGDYTITTAKDKRPVLFTGGMSTCIAVGLYDPRTHTVGMAHFLTLSNNPESFNTVFRAMNPRANDDELRLVAKRTRVVIWGGGLTNYSFDFAAKLVGMMEEWEWDMSLVGSGLFERRKEYSAKGFTDTFGIDARDGTLYHDFAESIYAKPASKQPFLAGPNQPLQRTRMRLRDDFQQRFRLKFQKR